MREILKEHNVTTTDDINRALKDMFGSLSATFTQRLLGSNLPKGVLEFHNGNLPICFIHFCLSMCKDFCGLFDICLHLLYHESAKNAMDTQITRFLGGP
jgi:hypothetical protein